MNVRIKRLAEGARIPTYGTEYSAGADLYAKDGTSYTIPPHKTVLIPLGFSIEIPEGYAGLIFARSGIATKRGLAPANKVGVIDADYRGEVMVALHNHSDREAVIEPYERIAQLLVMPYITADFCECDALDETARGVGGFGSTGTR